MKEVLGEHRLFVSQQSLAGHSGEACAAALIFQDLYWGECLVVGCLFFRLVGFFWWVVFCFCFFLQLAPLCQREGICFTLWMHDLRGTLILFMA